jgi:hypothetical protein
MNEITKERLHELFEYRDGALYWKIRPAQVVQIGDRAGSAIVGSRRYRQVRIDRKNYSEHRLIYLMFNGSLPAVIDHIDCDPNNNRIENLRPCTNQENGRNRRGSCASGVKGVGWHKYRKQWVVQLNVNGKNTHFGYFTNIKEAERMAKFVRHLFHGEFARD